MANVNRPNGFRPAGGYPYYAPKVWPVAAAMTIAIGDAVIEDGAGRVSIGLANSGTILGVAATPVTASDVDDDIWIFDNPDQVFEGQCSGNGALADVNTCRTTANAFDIEGTTGIMEINEDASTEDVVKVLGTGVDPVTGIESKVGANQRKVFIWNIHALRRAATSVDV